MSDNFRKTAALAVVSKFPVTFEEKLRAFLDAHIQIGKRGIDRQKDPDKGKNPDMVLRNFYMREEIFDLACKINAKNIGLDYRPWVYWMVNSYIRNLHNEVIVYSPNQFRSRYAEKEIGKALKAYFDKPIRFEVDGQLFEEMRAA